MRDIDGSALPVPEFLDLSVNVVCSDPALHIIPLNPQTQQAFTLLLNANNSARTLHYSGRNSSEDGNDGLYAIMFSCGGERAAVRRGNLITTEPINADFLFRFILADVEDDLAKWLLRCFGYFSGKMTVQPESTSEKLVVVSAGECKVCAGRLFDSIELEWRVCNDCSRVCQHEYVEGVGQSNGNLAFLPFCKTCGRGDPDWQPSENPAEDIINTVAKGGIDFLLIDHQDGSSTLISKNTEPSTQEM